MTQEQLQLEWPTAPQLLSPDEIYEKANGQLLPRLNENPYFERKPPGVHGAYLGDYFSMFANTPPDGGVIAIGLANDGTIVGCLSQSTDHLNNLERAGDVFCPEARYTSKRVPVRRQDHGEDFVILVRVWYRPDKVAETAKGHAFIRRGESKKRLTEEEKRELQISKGQLAIELDPCPALVYPRDFDEDLIASAVQSFSTRHQLQYVTSTEEILERMHLGQRTGDTFVPNLACVILFARQPTQLVPGCTLRLLRFEGDQEGTGERFNAVKDEWIEGPLPKLVDEAAHLLRAQLRDFSRLGRDGKFYTAPEYPEPAWYEAIVNACVHRSYGLKNMNIFVKVFDDRLEVESPGGFPGIVTPENIYDIHYPRNPHLMKAMYYLDFVKCATEGTRRMRDTMAQVELPAPEFGEREIGYQLVRVVLRNNIQQRRIWIDADAAGVVGEMIFRTLTEDEKRIINFVAEHGEINVSQVQRLTSVRSWLGAKKILTRLAHRGLLERVGRPEGERDPKARFRLGASS